MIVDVCSGHRYRAKIALGFFEAITPNATIAGQLRDVGLDDVLVTGTGHDREALATWNGPDTNGVRLPMQIVEVFDLGFPP